MYTVALLALPWIVLAIGKLPHPVYQGKCLEVFNFGLAVLYLFTDNLILMIVILWNCANAIFDLSQLPELSKISELLQNY